MNEEDRFLHQAVELARANIARGGRPFGAVVVRDGEVLATGVNEILAKPFAEQSMDIRHRPVSPPDLYAQWAQAEDRKA